MFKGVEDVKKDIIANGIAIGSNEGVRDRLVDGLFERNNDGSSGGMDEGTKE